MIQRYSGIPRGCGMVLVAQQQLGEIMAQRPDPQNHQINRGGRHSNAGLHLNYVKSILF